jgi:hypothetical protein
MNDRDATADWLLSVQGRIARIVAGSLLIIIGLGVIGGFLGVLLMLIGAVPIASAAYGTLLVGPLLGRDIRGRRPDQQPDEDEDEDGEDGEEKDAPRDEERSESDDDAPDPEWSAPPLARAERAPGQEPRTRDIRAEQPTASEDDSHE